MVIYTPSIWPPTLLHNDHLLSLNMAIFSSLIWSSTLLQYDHLLSFNMTIYSPSIWPSTLLQYGHLLFFNMVIYTPSIWPSTLLHHRCFFLWKSCIIVLKTTLTWYINIWRINIQLKVYNCIDYIEYSLHYAQNRLAKNGQFAEN